MARSKVIDMQFVFPADPLNSKKIDAYFKPQADALAAYGQYALYSVEEAKLSGVRQDQTVVYRGWMLDQFQYISLESLILINGGKPLTYFEQYINTHHLPNWYYLLKDLTPQTVCYPKGWLSDTDDAEYLVKELTKLNWPEGFFLKDYVKSLNTNGGSHVHQAVDAPRVVEMMTKYRGTLEGGLCVRRYEHFYGEERYFVVKGKVFTKAPESPAWSTFLEGVLTDIASRIDSPFFSIDLALNDKGKLRVVEIGDGQVSDLKEGWTPAMLTSMFEHLEEA